MRKVLLASIAVAALGPMSSSHASTVVCDAVGTASNILHLEGECSGGIELGD